jgi:hypothetical protein
VRELPRGPRERSDNRHHRERDCDQDNLDARSTSLWLPTPVPEPRVNGCSSSFGDLCAGPTDRRWRYCPDVASGHLGGRLEGEKGSLFVKVGTPSALKISTPAN